MKIDILSEKIINELAITFKNKQSVEFEYNNLFYEIFESCDTGYIVNLYSSNEKDKNGEYLKINNVDGGLCTGSASDAVWFIV